MTAYHPINQLQTASRYWTQSWASTATVLQIAGEVIEEASYDTEGVWSLELPDTSCIEDWVSSQSLMGLGNRINDKSGRSPLEQQKLLMDLTRFRKEAEMGLSCVLRSEVSAEARAIRGYLDFYKTASEMRISLHTM